MASGSFRVSSVHVFPVNEPMIPEFPELWWWSTVWVPGITSIWYFNSPKMTHLIVYRITLIVNPACKCMCFTDPDWVNLFQIIHTDSNTVLGQNDTGFSCDGSANTFRVMFKEPVEVLPNVNYTACATLKVRSCVYQLICLN